MHKQCWGVNHLRWDTFERLDLHAKMHNHVKYAANAIYGCPLALCNSEPLGIDRYSAARNDKTML